MQNKQILKTIILYNNTNNIYMLVTTLKNNKTSNTIMCSNNLQTLQQNCTKSYTQIQQYNNLYYTQLQTAQVTKQQAQQIINSCNLYN